MAVAASTSTGMGGTDGVDCVGALIKDAGHRVFVHRRTAGRRLLPGTWDVVGGHVEPGERPEEALAREIEEETGWRLARVEAELGDWEWRGDDARVRRERDYLVEVAGDLDAPRLEEGKHDACAWVGPGGADYELMMEGRRDGDRRLLELVKRAARTRLTERLRLEPIGPRHAVELWRLHHDPEVARWHAGTWTPETARERAREFGERWDAEGVHKWIAYARVSGAVVGRGGLSRQEVAGVRDRLELGWTIRSSLWGRGLATEIGRAGLAYAFRELGAGEVVAFTEPENSRSRAVMERLGMRYRGEFTRGGPRGAQEFVLYAADRGIAERALAAPPPGPA